MKSKAKYFIAAICSSIIWGFFSIPLRSLKQYPSQEILIYRIFLSLILTWSIILFRQKRVIADIRYIKSLDFSERKNLLWMVLLAGFLVTGNWYSYIYAVNNVSLKSAALAYIICPLITALGGFFILKEHLTKLKLAAIGIASLSILLLARGSLREVLWSVFIASLYAFYLIIQRAVKFIDKMNMLGVQLVISSALIFPLFISQNTTVPTSWTFWITIFFIALVFTIIPLFLSLYALTGIPSSTMGILIYINPVVSFSIAIFYFHEDINRLQILSYSLLLVAIVVFNWNMLYKFFFLNNAHQQNIDL